MEDNIKVNVVKCRTIQLEDESGNVIGTIGLRYADRQLAISFPEINLRDGNVYLPDLTHVYVLREGKSVTLASLLR